MIAMLCSATSFISCTAYWALMGCRMARRAEWNVASGTWRLAAEAFLPLIAAVIASVSNVRTKHRPDLAF